MTKVETEYIQSLQYIQSYNIFGLYNIFGSNITFTFQ